MVHFSSLFLVNFGLPPVSSQSFPLGADGAGGDYAFSAGDGADAVV